VQALYPEGDPRRQSKKNFKFRLAPPEASDRLTGFTHNSVAPFGMLTDIPIVLDSNIAEIDGGYFWMVSGKQRQGARCPTDNHHPPPRDLTLRTPRALLVFNPPCDA
jgi:hypothetical protein